LVEVFFQITFAYSLRGYQSFIYYLIQDQFGALLPAEVPVNEKFPSAVIVDYPGSNWILNAPSGGYWLPNAFRDTLGAQPYTSSPPPIPVPLTPQTPLTSINVLHFDQEFYVGNITPSVGRRVQTDVAQFYLDHGLHLNVLSPRP
jgi:hypothetical protein